MFKSLFTRTVVTYFAILSIVFGLFGLYSIISIRQSIYNDKKDQLLVEAEQINKMTTDYGENSIYDQMYSVYLQNISHQYKATIWIFDSKAEGVMISDSKTKLVSVQSDEDFSKDMNSLLSGSDIVKSDYFEDSKGGEVLTVAIPREINDKIVGAIFIHAPLQELGQTYESMFPRIWATIVIAMAVGIIAIAFTTYKMINPLLEMNIVAKDISKGIFKRRLKVTSSDEIGQLSTSFNTMADELSNAEEMRKSLIANVSHELRSPLTSIIGFVQGIRDGTISDKDKDFYLDIVLDESKRLTKLIRDLLDLSQLESGEFPLKRTQFDINEITAQTLIKQTNRIESKGINVEVEFCNEKCIVDADVERIEQVLTNLIDNAIKYVDENKQIKIYTVVKNNKVYISIRNTGCIKDEDFPRVFDRFYIGDKARSPGAGTGLGLSIVKKIMEQHGEEIWAENKSEKYTEFTFTLQAPNINSAEDKKHIENEGE